jgi:hypothetical protein
MLSGASGSFRDRVDGAPGCRRKQQDGKKKKIFHEAHLESALGQESSDWEKLIFG